VVTVSVAVTGEVPVTLKFWGEAEQEIPQFEEEVEQVRFIGPVNPYRGVMVIVAVPDCPGAEMLIVVGFADTLKSVIVIEDAGAEVEPA
jgi:hypothetical protein